MYGPTRAKRGEKSGDLNSRKLHKRFLELRSCDLLGGRLALMTTSDSMYRPTRSKHGEKSGDLNSRKLHKQFLELRSCDLLGGRPP